jgi:hypothetical protein
MYKKILFFMNIVTVLQVVGIQAMQNNQEDNSAYDDIEQEQIVNNAPSPVPGAPVSPHAAPPSPLQLSANPAAAIAPKRTLSEKEIAEIELTPETVQEKVLRKIGNWWSGTDEYFLHVLRSLSPNQTISHSISNQRVILSAVQNLIKKENFLNIQEFLNYATEKRASKPLFIIDTTATHALKKFLQATHKKQMEPVQKTIELMKSLQTIENEHSAVKKDAADEKVNNKQ